MNKMYYIKKNQQLASAVILCICVCIYMAICLFVHYNIHCEQIANYIYAAILYI